jgi:hypothetical protein
MAELDTSWVVQLIIQELRNSDAEGDQRIEDAVTSVRSKYFIDNRDVLQQAATEVAEMLGRQFPASTTPIVGNRPADPWFIRTPEKDVFWPGFERSLRGRLREDAIESIDDVSLDVLNRLPAPRRPVIGSRGLVVGYVQSGKTTSFTALMASAADGGYRLFVVLAGMYNNLRRQTQGRLDRDLVEPTKDRWFQLTDAERDFGNPGNAQALIAQFDGKFLAVVKKYISRLGRLNDWLDTIPEPALRSLPILVIDDESDQASLNVSADDRSGINREIIRLLDRPKAAYVGYTASPFANILGPDAGDLRDLYPRDFIVPLPHPLGYFGPERIFGRASLGTEDEPVGGCDIVRTVSPNEEDELNVPSRREERQAYSPEMPASLRRAVTWFLLATAERRRRGQIDSNAHSTMLVHVSHYTDAHRTLIDLVNADLSSIRTEFAAGDLDSWLEEQWEEEMRRVADGPCRSEYGLAPFDALREHVRDTLSRVRVIVDNAESEDRLDYSAGDGYLDVIVIGGNTLSRGLTLEGLVSSYFVRSSRNYDTLLQMGRWFGYRIGYEDLPRIWMTDELADSFEFFALLEEEMRTYMRELAADPTSTPEDVGIKIRTHPAMSITSAMKMRAASVVRASLSSYRGEVIIYHRTGEIPQRNFEAASTLIADVIQSGVASKSKSGVHLYTGIAGARILRFFEQYVLHNRNQILTNSSVTDYIKKEMGHGALAAWSIAVLSPASERPGLGTLKLGGETFNLASRTRLPDDHPDVANIGVLRNDLADFHVDLDHSSRGSDDPPLLLLYPIGKNSQPSGENTRRLPLDADEHLIGVAVSFPYSPRHTEVEWAVPMLQAMPEEADEEDEPANLSELDTEGDSTGD